MADLEGLAISLTRGKQDEVKAKVQAALDEGLSPVAVLNDGLVAGMSVWNGHVSYSRTSIS